MYHFLPSSGMNLVRRWDFFPLVYIFLLKIENMQQQPFPIYFEVEFDLNDNFFCSILTVAEWGKKSRVCRSICPCICDHILLFCYFTQTGYITLLWLTIIASRLICSDIWRFNEVFYVMFFSSARYLWNFMKIYVTHDAKLNNAIINT